MNKIGGLLTKGDLLEFCETVEELGWCHIRVKLRPGVDKLWFLDNVVPVFFKVEFDDSV
jgi:hypothetical protein